MHSIAIIGSGPTAIYTAKYLVSQYKSLSITLYEAQSEAGKGTPYHQDWNAKEMLSNIASIEIPPVTETLVAWLSSQTPDTLAHIGVAAEDITERAFLPRVALGEFFQAQLKKLERSAGMHGSSLTIHTCHKVQDAMMIESGVKLAIECNGNTHHAVFDFVVMATGHVWPTETETKPGYFLSPWPAATLRTIPDCHVGIRGTSLSAIDAAVALATARGAFWRTSEGKLHYFPEPGTEAFHITMMSRKGILPEADFYHPIPYLPLSICTKEAVDTLIADRPAALLDAVFALFKAELTASDPAYAADMQLADLSLEAFSKAYFHEREQHDPFLWAEKNLAEAREHHKHQFTVAWRYAILRMHEIIAHAVPHFSAEDHVRFRHSFKHVFVDDYATVPHESIERMLALYGAGKLAVLAIGDDYTLDTEAFETGVMLTRGAERMYFPAFIEATGQRALSVQEFPFKTLWKQGLLEKATALETVSHFFGHTIKKQKDIGGIELDGAFHPVSDSPLASRLYCLSLPFMLGQFPFAQGITSSHDMGRKVALDIIKQITSPSGPAIVKEAGSQSLPVLRSA